MSRGLFEVLQPIASGAKSGLGSPSACQDALRVTSHRCVSGERHKGQGSSPAVSTYLQGPCDMSESSGGTRVINKEGED